MKLTVEQWLKEKAEYMAQKDNKDNHTFLCINEEASLDRSYPVQVSAPNEEMAALYASKVSEGYKENVMAVVCAIPANIEGAIKMYTGHGVHGGVLLLHEVEAEEVFDIV